jgi:hypothetical protein
MPIFFLIVQSRTRIFLLGNVLSTFSEVFSEEIASKYDAAEKRIRIECPASGPEIAPLTSS